MFSNKNRDAILEQINQSSFDIIVIGGGITGCGIALDAASKGLKVLLLEKDDFASGTSSRSTKLIHGGLRYLKGLEFQLVAEVGRERAIVHRNAMHLVYPEKMLLPIVKKGTLGKFATGIGLWLYDLLAGVHGSQKRVMLNKDETIKEEPCLRSDILLGGGLYYEYRTNDARLTMEVLKTACIAHHALALNYAPVKKFIYQNGLLEGLEFTDELTKKKHTVTGKQIINATGPWVDDLRKMDQSMNHKRIIHSKGIHIVLPKEKLPLKHAVYFDVSDGRMIFAIPAEDIVYIGTTDTFYDGPIDNPTIAEEDIVYLLNTIPQIFQVEKVEKTDILSAWSGVRPLIYEEGKKAGELSRHDEIFNAPSGLMSIAGGKLTGYRLMAEKVVEECYKKWNQPISVSNTKDMRLHGANFADEEVMKNTLKDYLEIASQQGIKADDLIDLFYKYGTDTPKIMSIFKEQIQPLVVAELRYCLENEMVTTLSDFIFRRTNYGLFASQKVDSIMIDLLLKHIREYFNFSDENMEQQRVKYEADLVHYFKK